MNITYLADSERVSLLTMHSMQISQGEAWHGKNNLRYNYLNYKHRPKVSRLISKFYALQSNIYYK